MIYLQLFYVFFLIGLFTVGGGYAMLSLIQSEVVIKHAWMTASQFTDIVAISQMTPGPIGINTATYVGYTVPMNIGCSKLLCVLGSVTSTLAVILPSFLIMLIICRMYEKIKGDATFKSVMGWIRPTVIGLIAAAVAMLMNGDNFIDWKSWVLFATAFILSIWKKINPIIIILAGGVAGFFLYYHF
ncbi:MAG: chromate transporter [Bacteroidales bacterium]|nr:chromate transporter [Bacteroidales bacterium]MCI2121916.1 chromate transporter [Bacteroidales bacterium]MCI2145622.1 chromate transporter [Bacteroidales bacterium]